jgi:hypothetical protein
MGGKRRFRYLDPLVSFKVCRQAPKQRGSMNAKDNATIPDNKLRQIENEKRCRDLVCRT